MKKNRRIKRHSRFTSGATGIAALIVSSFIMLMIYWSLDVRCTAILREIGKAESQMKALESELGRELSRWNEMKTPERLDEKVTRFGLAMANAQPDQVVRMMPNGRPAPGQMAVARAQSKTRMGNMAMAVPRKRPASRRR